MARKSYLTDVDSTLDAEISSLQESLPVHLHATGQSALRGRRRDIITGAPVPTAPAGGGEADESAAAAPAEPDAFPGDAGETLREPAPYGQPGGALPPAYAPMPAPSAGWSAKPKGGVRATVAASIGGDIAQEIARLEQLRDWIREDPAFGRLVDRLIGNQVVRSERRQRLYSAVIGACTLVAGWLLSAVSPVSALAHLFGH